MIFKIERKTNEPPIEHLLSCCPPPSSIPAIMLDCFEIVTTSGVVLWSKTYAPVGAHIINGLINDVFIEEKLRLKQAKNEAGASPAYKREKYTLKWRRAKNLGLIFVVCCPLLCTPISCISYIYIYVMI